jgi:hypothetical protein
MTNTGMVAAIGNGLFVRTNAGSSLLDTYRRKQAACAHAKLDPKGTCYRCPAEGGQVAMFAAISEPAARIVKALTLADLMDAAGISAADAATMHPGEWRIVARAANTPREPSERTRELVTALLQRREAARAMFAKKNPRN